MGRKSKTGSNPKWIPSAVDWKISEKNEIFITLHLSGISTNCGCFRATFYLNLSDLPSCILLR